MSKKKDSKIHTLYNPTIQYQLLIFLWKLFLGSIPSIIPVYFKCNNLLYECLLYSLSLAFWWIILWLLSFKKPKGHKQNRFNLSDWLHSMLSIIIIMFFLFTLIKRILFTQNANETSVNWFFYLPLPFCNAK
jgi:uncharacterized membrane protein